MSTGRHNCWGIAWAPSCGLAMAELILDGESKSVDLRYFNPSRLQPKLVEGGGENREVKVLASSGSLSCCNIFYNVKYFE